MYIYIIDRISVDIFKRNYFPIFVKVSVAKIIVTAVRNNVMLTI